MAIDIASPGADEADLIAALQPLVLTPTFLSTLQALIGCQPFVVAGVEPGTTFDVSGSTCPPVLSGIFSLPEAGTNWIHPDHITDIVFRNCTGYTQLNFDDFSGATSLDLTGTDVSAVTEFAIPGGMTTIDLSDFTGLTGFFAAEGSAITNITIPSTVLTYFNAVDCTSLTSVDVSAGALNLSVTLSGCTAMTTLAVPNPWEPGDAFDGFGLALSESSVDGVLVALAASTADNGTVTLNGANAIPSATGLAAKATLEGRGWTVTVSD